jgi:hypothetical protein
MVILNRRQTPEEDETAVVVVWFVPAVIPLETVLHVQTLAAFALNQIPDVHVVDWPIPILTCEVFEAESGDINK